MVHIGSSNVDLLEKLTADQFTREDFEQLNASGKTCSNGELDAQDLRPQST